MVGIIPARAGFTPHTPSTSTPSADHPRSRGVYIINIDMMVIAQGSSPLARGLHEFSEPGACDIRIIPARAGFTQQGLYE